MGGGARLVFKGGIDLNCDLCDDEIWDGDRSHDFKGVGGTANLCGSCYLEMEEIDRVKGRLHVDVCKECGKVKGCYFVNYKPKPGRKPAAAVDPMEKAQKNGEILLDNFQEEKKEK